MADIYRYRGEVATLQVEISILTIREVCVYGFDASVLTTRVLVARNEQAAFEGVRSGTNIFLRIGITAYGGAINGRNASIVIIRFNVHIAVASFGCRDACVKIQVSTYVLIADCFTVQ